MDIFEAADRAMADGEVIASRGITINVKIDDDPLATKVVGQERRGRRQSNVLLKSKSKCGTGFPFGSDLRMRRRFALMRHKTWRDSPRLRKNTKSEYYKQEGNPIWTVYAAAELAWIHTGKRKPEPSQGGKFYLKNRNTFVGECESFWRFTNNRVFHMKNLRRQRGPSPNAEKLFKTAISAYVARQLCHPKGGNTLFAPTPRDISQAWYLVFGEIEKPDCIKNRLKTVSQYCKRYHLEYTGRTPTRFYGLARGLEKKYGKNRTRF